jgi:CBS domain-containing protein
MAVITAAMLRSLLFAHGPLFPASFDPGISISGIAAWLGIGVAAGLGSAVLTIAVYATEDLFQKLPLHWMWWPAIGGLVVGIGGLIEPAALGVGYDSIQRLIDGSLAIQALCLLLVVKATIWSIALGSGTSGGVLAPLIIIGGSLGALLAGILSPAHVALFALLGMAAMMGGTMRSPLTATFFAMELTGSMNVLLPLLTACAAAHAVTVLVMKRSILTERIARRGHHIMREYSVDPFEMTRVKDVMTTQVDTLPAAMTVQEAIRFFTTDAHRHKSYPVIDTEERPIGMLSRADILRWTLDDADDAGTLADAFQDSELLVAAADEPLAQLADRMAQADVGRVPVVHRKTRKLAGLIARKDLLHARARLLAQERDRSAPLRGGSTPRSSEPPTVGQAVT